MSMFRSLQHSPGSITIFHNAKNPLSESLLNKLQHSVYNSTRHKENLNKNSTFLQKLFNAFKSEKELNKPTQIKTNNKKISNDGSSSKVSTSDYLKGKQFRYTLDISTIPPTPEQFQFISSILQTHPICKKSFIHAFPNFSKDMNHVSDTDGIPKTVQELKKVFSDKSLQELDNENYFKTPLVVDWENELIATNEKDVEKILDNYKRTDEGIES
ncbi:hypothetical protein BVG19_g4985 [[Candida] boidinii]|nr:hypothetical protein BVG19_g4985 [[Candida] boidinii]OWB53557.1 hypothetical protein B5S27_g5160 [[Candida] boidinii]